MNVGKAEVAARRRCIVQFIGRKIVPQPIAAVVGEPQFAGLRVPVEPHRISHALGKYLEA